jgi:hypothetical protein
MVRACAATNEQQNNQKSGVSHRERISPRTSTAEIYTPVSAVARRLSGMPIARRRPSLLRPIPAGPRPATRFSSSRHRKFARRAAAHEATFELIESCHSPNRTKICDGIWIAWQSPTPAGRSRESDSEPRPDGPGISQTADSESRSLSPGSPTSTSSGIASWNFPIAAEYALTRSSCVSLPFS